MAQSCPAAGVVGEVQRAGRFQGVARTQARNSASMS